MILTSLLWGRLWFETWCIVLCAFPKNLRIWLDKPWLEYLLKMTLAIEMKRINLRFGEFLVCGFCWVRCKWSKNLWFDVHRLVTSRLEDCNEERESFYDHNVKLLHGNGERWTKSLYVNGVTRKNILLWNGKVFFIFPKVHMIFLCEFNKFHYIGNC